MANYYVKLPVDPRTSFNPASTVYVAKNGSDSTGNGSFNNPFLTIEAAEASITTATTANPFVIIIYPGFYQPASGFLKKQNIFWVGTDRKATLIGTGSISSTGIQCTADSVGGNIGFLHITFQGPKGFNFIQTSTSGPLNVYMEDVRLGFSPAITFTGGVGGYIEIHHSDVIGSTVLHSVFMYSTGTYYGGRITADGQGALYPQTPVVVNGNTTSGSNIITFTSTAGIQQGNVISGSGIPVGAKVGPVTPTQITISANATATATNVPLSFTKNISSLVEIYHGTFAGMTLHDMSSAILSAYNQGTLVADSAGSNIIATPDAAGGKSFVTLSNGATLQLSIDASVLGYLPATPGNWALTPTDTANALDQLAASSVAGLANTDGLYSLKNTSDTTKLQHFDLSGQTTGTTLTLSPQITSSMVLNIPPIATSSGAAMMLLQDRTTGFIFSDGITSSIGGANSMMQLANATVGNRAQIKLHSYFNGTSVAGVSTLTSRSGTIAVNSAIVAGQDYSKWTAQAAATTPGSAPISGTFAFKANTVNSLTVTSDFHLQLTNLAGTLTDALYLTSEGDLSVGTANLNGAVLSPNSPLVINNGHIKSTQTTSPTANINANAGTGASSSVNNATDSAGVLNLTSGSASFSSGVQTTVSFNKAYNVAPIVMITPANAQAASDSVAHDIFVSSTVNDFSINFGVAQNNAGVSYVWNYMVIETQ